MEQRKVSALVLALLGAFVCMVTQGCSGTKTTPQPPGGLLDEFTRLDTSIWSVSKGQPAVEDGWLVLTSTPGQGEEVQSHRSFKYGSLEFKATSEHWPVDSSLGAECWTGSIHRAIVVTNGHLGIIDQSKGSPNEWYQRIPDWDSIKDEAHVFKIVWTSGKIELLMDGKSVLTYEGSLVPDSDLKVRLNASNDYNDTIRVDRVSVSENAQQ